MEGDSKAKDMRDVLRPDPQQAKRNLLETAKSIDWLAPLRDHPLATVGISAALGAVAGSSPKTMAAATRVVRTLIPVVEKGANAFLQAQMARQEPSVESATTDEVDETFDAAGVH